jgi:hypothetical protein
MTLSATDHAIDTGDFLCRDRNTKCLQQMQHCLGPTHGLNEIQTESDTRFAVTAIDERCASLRTIFPTDRYFNSGLKRL